MPIRPFMVLAAALALFAAGRPALADPPPDPRQTITIQLENDSTRPASDDYYTSGERIAWTSPTGAVPDPIAGFGHLLLGQGQQRIGLELSQNIFTPLYDQLSVPLPGDRPYAAVLLATGSLIQDTDTTRTALSLGLGLIGPAALGEALQNGFHNVIGQTTVRGWSHQIGNQPVIQLTGERTLRLPLGTIGGLETDVLPSATLAAGTFRIYAQAGGTVRIGQGLDSDFGVPRIRPGLTGTHAYTPTRPFTWYFFIGGDGQAVAWDETLNGLPFGASPHVSKQPFVGELQYGFAMMAWGMRLTATQILQTNEFAGQTNGRFQFTSVALSAKF